MAVSPWSVVRTQQKRADRVDADTQLCDNAHSLGELAASLGAQQETYDALKLSFATGVVTDNVGQSRLESGQAEYDAGSEKLAAAKAQYAAGQAQLEQGKADYAAGQEKLAAAKEEYAAGQAQLARIQPVYDAVHPAYQRYLDRQAEYDAAVASGDLAKAALLWPGVTAQKQLYETQLIGTGYSIESLVQAYEAGQAKLSAGAAQIAAAEQQLQDAQAQLAAGQQALDAAAAEIAAGQSKLDTAAGTLASGRQTLAANRQQLAQDLAALAPYEDDTERLEQGGVAALSITGLTGETAPAVETDLGSVQCVRLGSGWRAYIPAAYNASAGGHTVNVTVNGETFARTLTVLPKDFGTVEVEPEPASTEAANTEFRNNIWPLYEQPVREKLWAGTFLCPAENYMTLVDFGQVRVTGGQQGSRSNSTRLYTIPGEPCRAPANGVVVFAGNLALTGSTVVIDHGCGVRSYLYGLQELSVTRGQTVERGQAVGVLGEELTMDFKLGSKSVNPWPLFQTSGGLFWQEKG